jgi:hypothetical protein
MVAISNVRELLFDKVNAGLAEPPKVVVANPLIEQIPVTFNLFTAIALSTPSTPDVLVFIVITDELAVTVPTVLAIYNVDEAPFIVMPVPKFNVPELLKLTLPEDVNKTPACEYETAAVTVKLCKDAPAEKVKALAASFTTISKNDFPALATDDEPVPTKLTINSPGSIVCNDPKDQLVVTVN